MTLNGSIETSFGDVIASGSYSNSTFNIYNGIDNETKTAPCVIVHVTDAQDLHPDTGCVQAQTSIIVKEMAADTTTIGQFADEVWAQIFGVDKTQYNISGSLSIFDIHRVNMIESANEDTHIFTMNLNVYCIHS